MASSFHLLGWFTLIYLFWATAILRCQKMCDVLILDGRQANGGWYILTYDQRRATGLQLWTTNSKLRFIANNPDARLLFIMRWFYIWNVETLIMLSFSRIQLSLLLVWLENTKWIEFNYVHISRNKIEAATSNFAIDSRHVLATVRSAKKPTLDIPFPIFISSISRPSWSELFMPTCQEVNSPVTIQENSYIFLGRWLMKWW